MPPKPKGGGTTKGRRKIQPLSDEEDSEDNEPIMTRKKQRADPVVPQNAFRAAQPPPNAPTWSPSVLPPGMVLTAQGQLVPQQQVQQGLVQQGLVQGAPVQQGHIQHGHVQHGHGVVQGAPVHQPHHGGMGVPAMGAPAMGGRQLPQQQPGGPQQRPAGDVVRASFAMEDLDDDSEPFEENAPDLLWSRKIRVSKEGLLIPCLRELGGNRRFIDSARAYVSTTFTFTPFAHRLVDQGLSRSTGISGQVTLALACDIIRGAPLPPRLTFDAKADKECAWRSSRQEIGEIAAGVANEGKGLLVKVTLDVTADIDELISLISTDDLEKPARATIVKVAVGYEGGNPVSFKIPLWPAGNDNLVCAILDAGIANIGHHAVSKMKMSAAPSFTLAGPSGAGKSTLLKAFGLPGAAVSSSGDHVGTRMPNKGTPIEYGNMPAKVHGKYLPELYDFPGVIMPSGARRPNETPGVKPEDIADLIHRIGYPRLMYDAAELPFDELLRRAKAEKRKHRAIVDMSAVVINAVSPVVKLALGEHSHLSEMRPEHLFEIFTGDKVHKSRTGAEVILRSEQKATTIFPGIFIVTKLDELPAIRKLVPKEQQSRFELVINYAHAPEDLVFAWQNKTVPVFEAIERFCIYLKGIYDRDVIFVNSHYGDRQRLGLVVLNAYDKMYLSLVENRLRMELDQKAYTEVAVCTESDDEGYDFDDLEKDLGARFADWIARTPKAIVGFLRNKAVHGDVGIFQSMIDNCKGEAQMTETLLKMWDRHQRGGKTEVKSEPPRDVDEEDAKPMAVVNAAAVNAVAAGNAVAVNAGQSIGNDGVEPEASEGASEAGSGSGADDEDDGEAKGAEDAGDAGDAGDAEDAEEKEGVNQEEGRDGMGQQEEGMKDEDDGGEAASASSLSGGEMSLVGPADTETGGDRNEDASHSMDVM